MQSACAIQKFAKTSRFARSGELADGFHRALDIRMQVEHLGTVPPRVSCEQRGRKQVQVIFKSTARIGEQRLEDVMHGEDGRTCIDRTAARRETAQLSADRFGTFD